MVPGLHLQERLPCGLVGADSVYFDLSLSPDAGHDDDDDQQQRLSCLLIRGVDGQTVVENRINRKWKSWPTNSRLH